jgi:hypothetical protein
MGIFNRVKRVAILGCGPSGMFAAHAFVDAGWDVTIYSKKRKSQMFGAQYLHSPIPGLPENRIEVNYLLEGTAEGYRDKVYGPNSTVQVSPDLLLGVHPAWDIRAAYDAAWERYEGLVVNANITPYWAVGEFVNPEADKYWRAIVSTIPAPALCIGPKGADGAEAHQFLSQKVWAAGDAPELNRWCPIRIPAGTVVCNGDPERGWYRSANVFGHSTAEWPHDRKPPISGLAEVVKPLSTNCDCWPRITRMGRYGAWQKGYLTDEVYVRAAKLAAKG